MRKPDMLQRGLRSYYQKKLSATRLISAAELTRPAIVFSPHPDDESLACGGTILRKKQAGAAVKVVFMTDGNASHPGLIPPEKLREIRMEEARAACIKLGLTEEDIFFLDFHDMYLNTCQAEATEKVTALLRQYQPEEIFIPLRDDPQLDHRATYRFVLDAVAQLGKRVIINEFAVWYWFHWPWVSIRQERRSDSEWAIRRTIRTIFGLRAPGRFNASVDIQTVREAKRAALDEHRSQMTRMPGQSGPTLESMSEGEFLDRFFQDREYFYRYEANSLSHLEGSNPQP